MSDDRTNGEQRAAAVQARAGAEEWTPSGRPVPRLPHMRQSSRVMKVSMVVFAIGLLAVVADLALFASGHHNLPLWLNLVALLAPVGFGLGLAGAYLEARRPAADGARN